MRQASPLHAWLHLALKLDAARNTHRNTHSKSTYPPRIAAHDSFTTQTCLGGLGAAMQLLEEVEIVIVVAGAVVRKLEINPHVVAEPLPVSETQPDGAISLHRATFISI